MCVRICQVLSKTVKYMIFICRLFFFLLKKYEKLKAKMFSVWCQHQMRSHGEHIQIHPSSSVLSLERISIGNNFNTGPMLRLRAYTDFGNHKYDATITIGNNFYAGDNCAIMAVGHIIIGNNVTLASRVTVIDHSHGIGDYSDMKEPVMERNLGVKGPIIIEDNVWLCEGVVILSNVKIGENAIIGANSVVTHDIPANSIAVGIPAKVIRTIEL